MSIRIVLVGTTHPGNIGAVARAMKNMGVMDLALVNPRYFPDKEATARASGAEDLLENATVFDTLADAIADCVYVAGASARSRAINWPCLDARDCAARLLDESRKGPVVRAVEFGSRSLRYAFDNSDESGIQFAESRDGRAGSHIRTAPGAGSEIARVRAWRWRIFTSISSAC
jgi:hypothetical protein